MLWRFCWFQELFCQFPCPALLTQLLPSALLYDSLTHTRASISFLIKCWLVLVCSCQSSWFGFLLWPLSHPEVPGDFFLEPKSLRCPRKALECGHFWQNRVSSRIPGNTKPKHKMQMGFRKIQDKKAPVTAPLHGTAASAVLSWNLWMQRRMLKTVNPSCCG